MNFWTNKNLHGSRTDPSFRLHGTRRTVQVFEQQTVWYSVTEFARFRSKICPEPCKGVIRYQPSNRGTKRNWLPQILTFLKGQQCLYLFWPFRKTVAAGAGKKIKLSLKNDKIRYTDSLLLPPTLADVMSVQPTTPLLHTGQLQMVMMSSGWIRSARNSLHLVSCDGISDEYSTKRFNWILDIAFAFSISNSLSILKWIGRDRRWLKNEYSVSFRSSLQKSHSFRKLSLSVAFESRCLENTYVWLKFFLFFLSFL